MAQVSVIIPTRNRAELLRGALNSVLEQTFVAFEVIVVDDASEDNTSEIVESIGDHRVRYVHHRERRGGSAARNTGVGHAKGEFIAFLDDDDEWLPGKLARQVSLILASPRQTGCIYTGYLSVDRSNGKILSERIPTKRGDLSVDLLAENCLGGTSSVLIKRNCFDKIGLFDESLPSFQDYDFWIRLSKCFHFDFVAEPLLRYYIHEEKISTNLDALNQGMQVMLSKHGSAPSLRKYFSYHYLSLGVRTCYAGRPALARSFYLQAMKLYPFEIRHYFNFALSLLGSRRFAKIKQAKGAKNVFAQGI